MTDLNAIGRLLIATGALLALAGVLLLVVGRVPWLGQLPGDLVFRRGPVTVFVPLVTSLVLSVLLTLALNIFLRR